MKKVLLDLSNADRWINSNLKSLRFYQKLLAQGSSFDLLIDNKIYEIKSSSALAGHNCLLLVESESSREFILNSSGAGKGYCLSGQPLRAVENAPNVWPAVLTGPAIIRTGTRNFAHFIWNEFDSLLELIDQKNTLECCQDVNSIYNLNSISNIRLVDTKELTKRPSVRLGSMLVTDRIRSYLYEMYGVSDQPQVATGRQTLLLGVRGPGKRAILNEFDFFSNLLDKLQSVADEIRIIFDGVTLPNNFSSHHMGIKSRVSACDQLIQQLIARAGSIPIINSNGIAFSEWLPLASSVNFYVTHEGTMQHKLAWIFPSKAGLCLIGRKSARSIAKWHQDQSQNSAKVNYLPPELFKISDIPDNFRNERYRPFHIVDVDESVRQTIRLIQEYILSNKV